MAFQARKVLQWIRHREDVDKELAMHAAEASLTSGGPCVSAHQPMSELADMEDHDLHTGTQPCKAPAQPVKHAANGSSQSAHAAMSQHAGVAACDPSRSRTSWPGNHSQQDVADNLQAVGGQSFNYHAANASSAAVQGMRSGRSYTLGKIGPSSTAQLADNGSGNARDVVDKAPGALPEKGPRGGGHVQDQPPILDQLHGSQSLQHMGQALCDRQPQSQEASPAEAQQGVFYWEPNSPAAQSPTAGDACLGQSDRVRGRAQDPASDRGASANATQHLQQRVAWHTILARRNRPQLLLPAACTFFQIWSGEPTSLSPRQTATLQDDVLLYRLLCYYFASQ